MKKRSKFLGALIALVAISGLATAGATYAYWNTLQYKDSYVVPVGTGLNLEVPVSGIVPAGKTLVPTGKSLNAYQIEQVELSYSVRIKENLVVPFSVEILDKKLGDGTTHADLVNINVVDAPETITNTAVTFNVIITLTEPSTIDIYNEVINKDITFKLVFTVALP